MRRMKKRNRRSGETLVETIVSFAVVLLTLTTITAVVQLSIRMNNKAMESAAALESAGAALEAGNSQTSLPGILTVTLPGYDQIPARAVTLHYYLHTTADGLLSWFEPNTMGGG